jgi:hypothetical protein
MGKKGWCIMATTATKKSKKVKKASKVRAYVFPTCVVVARSKDEAIERHVDEGGAEGTEPTTLVARFAY